jgi:hypothetical protein
VNGSEDKCPDALRHFRKTFDLYDVDGRGHEMADLASCIRQISGQVKKKYGSADNSTTTARLHTYITMHAAKSNCKLGIETIVM